MNPRLSRTKASHRRRVLVEALERRQLLSISLLDNGILIVDGTSGADTIVISRDPTTKGMLRVGVNGFLNVVDERAVKRMNISGLEGNDQIFVDQSGGKISTPMNIAGGNGSDTITGGSGNDLLQGGRNSDVIRGSGGNDVLEGYYGNDTLFGGDGKDQLFGGFGNDSLFTGGETEGAVAGGGQKGDRIDRTVPSFKPAIQSKNAGAKPNFFSATPTGLTPDQVRKVYGLDNLGLTGAGQTIAIVDAFDAPTVRADLVEFSKEFGLPIPTKSSFQVYYATKVRPNYDNGWSGETSLDVQWAHAIAPEARIILVEAATNSNADLTQAFDRAVELLQPTGGAVSMSLGRDEFFFDSLNEQHFHNKNTGNISFIAASGDFGAQVSWPAVSPYVTATGGTFLDLDPVTDNLLAEQGWTGSGGGISSFTPRPLYQAGVTYGNSSLDNRRAVPDVSYNADPRSGVSVYNTSPDIFGDTGWQTVGGTSAAAPQWAGITALVNQKRAQDGKGVIGDALNTALYKLAATDRAANFTDITSGTNGYSTFTGYDLVTGNGSPKGASIVNALAADDNPSGGSNLKFSAARLAREPDSSTRPVPRLIFGGTGTAIQNGNDWDVSISPNARSGVSIAMDGPLTDDGFGHLQSFGSVSLVIGPRTTLTYRLKVVGHVETRADGDHLVGEFYIVSKRGKLLYQGDKPAFYGTFSA